MRDVVHRSFPRAISLASAAFALVLALTLPTASSAYAAGPGSSPSGSPLPDAAGAGSSNGTPGSSNTYFPEDCAPRIRNGIVLGLSLGVGLAGASGYPNQASRIGDPAYYASSPLMVGSGTWFHVMGALADWVNFGIWFGTSSFSSKNWKSNGGGGGFRVELFPFEELYKSNAFLRDLAVFGQFGIGGATLEVTAPGNYPSADGTETFIGAGVFYEKNLGRGLGGHFALGPSLEYDAIISTGFERHSALLAGRFVWYGGSP
jgi:hypothetical protein